MNTANNLAVTELLLGRPEAAAPMFAEAVRLRRELFGPSAALAALINNYAKTLLQQGDAATALPLAEEAASMARSFAGEGSMLHAAATAGQSEALIGVDRVPEALTVAEAGLQSARAASGPGTPPDTVALIAVIRALAAGGQTAAAEALLPEAEAGVAGIGPAGARLGAALSELTARYRLTPLAAQSPR
jgi:non-specific serine/threonine protein kinase/serine/threonine-protein kinase